MKIMKRSSTKSLVTWIKELDILVTYLGKSIPFAHVLCSVKTDKPYQYQAQTYSH